MLAVTAAQSRNQRTELQGELSLWRSEVQHLHREYRTALVELHRLEAALQQRAQTLEDYAAALEEQEERLAAAEWHKPAEGAGSPTEVGTHEILKHWRRREEHERIKRQHYAALAYVSLLLQVLSEPREVAGGLAGPEVPSRFHG
jgi:chromosome segregation ATPase